MPAGNPDSRYRFEVSAWAFTALNRTHPTLFSGSLASPSCVRAVAASAPCRMDAGLRLIS